MKIFFSYGHDEHSEFVSRLAGEIEKRSDKSIQVWIDSNKITRDSHWRERITDGIIDSDSVIAFLSSYSSREESVCRDELSIALVSKHGMIRTILLEKPGKNFTPPSRVSEYQWGDLSDYPKMKEKGEEAYSAYIKQEADKIIALVNSDEMKQYAEDVQALRHSFHMPDIDTWTKFDTLIDKELIGREWLFKRVQEWEEDEKESQVLIICGKPGAGKSMFSAHLQMRDPAVVAAFPCDCRHSEYNNTQSIIMQIAYRIALRLPDYRRVVLERLNDPQYNLDRDSLFEDLILQPLSMMNIDGNRAVMLIVVDALDEAENDSLADFISSNANSLKKYVRFLVTSRKVPSIVERFSQFKQIDMDAEEEATKTDLAAYYERKLAEKLKGPDKEDFIQRLIKNSGGVFTYAECVTNNILDDIRQDKFTINDYPLPAGIDALFRDTLDRTFHRSGAAYTENDYINRWRTPLGMILASPEPMPISTLRSLMNWKNSDLKDFRRPLFSLLTETEGILTLFHRSFGEWLEKTDTSYAVSKEDGISDLAEACFNIYTDCPDNMDEYMLLYTTQFLRESRKRTHREYYRRISLDQGYMGRLSDKAETLLKKVAFERAMAFYSELLLIYRELNECYPENPDYLWGYSVSLKDVAWGYWDLCEYDSALEYYKEALETRQELKERYPENLDYLEGYSDSQESIAYIYEDRNELDRALEYYEKALAINQELKERYPENPDYLDGYSASLKSIAGIYEKRNELDRALDYYKKALAICRELKEQYPENPYYLEGYSASLISIPRIYEARNELDNALEYYKEALEFFKNLYPEHCSFCLQCDYSITLISIARIYEARNELDNALEYYKENIEIGRCLDPDDLGNSFSLEKVAGIYEARKELDSALEYYKKVLEIRQELKDLYPENPDYMRDYSIALKNIERIQEITKQDK